MRGTLSKVPKIVGGGADTPSKVMLPQTVHDDTGGPRVIGLDDPLGQGQTTTTGIASMHRRRAFQFLCPENRGDSGGDYFLVLDVRIATHVDMKGRGRFAMLLHDLGIHAGGLGALGQVLRDLLLELLALLEEPHLHPLGLRHRQGNIDGELLTRVGLHTEVEGLSTTRLPHVDSHHVASGLQGREKFPVRVKLLVGCDDSAPLQDMLPVEVKIYVFVVNEGEPQLLRYALEKKCSLGPEILAVPLGVDLYSRCSGLAEARPPPLPLLVLVTEVHCRPV